MSISVLIAEDEQRVRGELKRLLESEEGVCVAEAADGEEAVRLTSEHRFHLVLMDIGMPRMDGLEATRLIKRSQPDTKVLILTVHEEEPYRRAAHGSGADAFVVKKMIIGELVPTIRRAPRKKTVMGKSALGRVDGRHAHSRDSTASGAVVSAVAALSSCSLATPCGGLLIEDSQFLMDSISFEDVARRRYACLAGHTLYDPPAGTAGMCQDAGEERV